MNRSSCIISANCTATRYNSPSEYRIVLIFSGNNTVFQTFSHLSTIPDFDGMKYPKCTKSTIHTTIFICLFTFQGVAIKMNNQGSPSLHICTMAKEDIIQSKDSKFAQGMQVTCPYLSCTFKNAIHCGVGRFPAGYKEF